MVIAALFILLLLRNPSCFVSLSLGEVFVLDDGGEVDLDLGNYERFLDTTLTRNNNITTGKIYSRVINNEVFPSFASFFSPG